MSNGTLNFGSSGAPVLFTVTNGVILGPAPGNKSQMTPFLNITGVASTAGFTITAIGASAFAACLAVTSVSIPDSVTSIGNNAFYSCTNIAGSLTLPSSLTSIGTNAFGGCSKLTGSLTIPNSVTSIGTNAFVGCTQFAGSLTISNSATSIGEYAFSGCAGFTGSLTIPSSMTSISVAAFANCAGFTSITIPDSVTSIGVNAFTNCSGVSSLSIGSGVTTISSGAFGGCSALTSIAIPNSVTSIGNGAFTGCSGVTTVSVGSGVTTIAGTAFANIHTGAQISFSCNNPPFLNTFSVGRSLELFYTSPSLTGWDVAVSGYTATLRGPPGPPTNTALSYSGTTGTLTFTAPANTGGSPILFYVVFYEGDIGGTVQYASADGDTTSVEMAGLANGSTNYVLVAQNTDYTGYSTSVAFTTEVSGGGGGAGDPYVTTFSSISYKLPTMNAPIRYFQTMDSGKLLTVNAQLKTVENAELADDTLRSLIVLRKKMTTKQYAAMVAKVMKPETLCFFERVSIQYGEQRLVVNLWDSKFELVENTLRCGVEKVDRADLLKKSGGIYSGYTADTVKLTLGRTAVFLSTYNSPLIRNGIYIESAATKGANGVIVNALSAGAMTLSSLASVEPVATKNSLKATTKVETFVDHEGLRTRNVVTYK